MYKLKFGVSMKAAQIVFSVALLCVTTQANAWFFFFLPGSVTSKIGDAITGAEGENCVTAAAKVGDVLKSPSGNTATIKSLSGTSSRCQDPNLPIRALLVFNYQFSSKAGIDIPNGFEQKPLTDMQRFQGNLLKAENSSLKSGVFVSSRGRDASTDSPAIAQAIATRMITTLEEGKTLNEEQLSVNGMKAYRFEVAGKSKALFHPKFTYVVTVLEGAQELVVVNAWTPTDDYDKNKDLLRSLAFRISGVNSTETEQAAVPSLPASTPVALPTATASQLQQTPLPASTLTGSTATPTQSGSGSVADKLRELDKLFKEGVITQPEYEAKKKELLKAL
ncbi:SHOCT domain-containing protein [Sphaerotilus sp.]|uniref:SHOCT domain-containing protein n=1 Tax=Sphaerotilus sp. TaxID=2093942 RepID=UPI0034E22077